MARRLLLVSANNNATQSRGIFYGGSDFGVYLPAWPKTI